MEKYTLTPFDGKKKEPVDCNSPEFIERELEVTDACGTVIDFTEAIREMHDKNVKNLIGKILTIVDATYSGEARVKAVKDLVHESFKPFKEAEARILGDEYNRLIEALVPEENQLLGFDPELDDESGLWVTKNSLPSLI